MALLSTKTFYEKYCTLINTVTTCVISLYLELLLAIFSEYDLSDIFNTSNIFCCLGFSFFLLAILGIFNNNKVATVIYVLITEIVTVFFLIEFFCLKTYGFFIDLNTVMSYADNVAGEYGSTVIGIIKKNIAIILTFHIPVVVLIIKAIIQPFKFKFNFISVTCFTLISACLITSGTYLSSIGNYKEEYTYDYQFNTAVSKFGLINAVYLDISYNIYGIPDSPIIDIEPVEIIDAETNTLDINWDDVLVATDDSTIISSINYLKNSTPSTKNDYTGLFEGKNLVLITAESFSSFLVREDYFPLIYKMATEGIVVSDYYQPFWGGTTSAGEASILSGIVPTDGYDTIHEMAANDTSFSMINLFNNLGYTTLAYHNGDYDYYNRYLTHPALGFSKFTASGTGMENYLSYIWPPSDNEMFSYIMNTTNYDNGPVLTYVMTYSGHGSYLNVDYNHQIALRNDSYLIGSEYYNDQMMKGYIAANLDLEFGLEKYVSYLESIGQLDNTVFIISPDHYPFFLTELVQYGGHNYLEDILGKVPENNMEQDTSCLIIWSPCLEELEEQIVVDKPCSSIDIVPTILNLWGIDFDSRLYIGRDILSDSTGLVVWNDGSWLSKDVYYDASSESMILRYENAVIDQSEYLDLQARAKNMVSLSRNILKYNLYEYISPYVKVKDANNEEELEVEE